MMLLEDYTQEIKNMIEEGKSNIELRRYTTSISTEYHAELMKILNSEYEYWEATHNVHRPTLAELLLTIPIGQFIYIQTPDERIIYSGKHKDLDYDTRMQYCAKLVVTQFWCDKVLRIYIEE